jgi:hypothetical protein
VYASRYREDFEKAFTELDLRRVPDRPPGVRGADGLTALEAQTPLAVFFSQFRLDGSRKDLYSRLIRYLHNADLLKCCLFSTLNYECLFEQAAQTVGLRVDYLLEAAAARLRPTAADVWRGASNTIYVAKLHGSCNFYTRNSQSLRALLSSATGVEVKISHADVWTPLEERAASERLSIMTQTSPDRDNFLSPANMFQIRQLWELAIRQASLIVIIGVAPREYDTHILTPLSAARGTIAYIGGAKDGHSWLRCNPNVRPLGRTFENGFRRLLMRVALWKRRRGGTFFSYMRDICRAWFY